MAENKYATWSDAYEIGNPEPLEPVGFGDYVKSIGSGSAKLIADQAAAAAAAQEGDGKSAMDSTAEKTRVLFNAVSDTLDDSRSSGAKRAAGASFIPEEGQAHALDEYKHFFGLNIASALPSTVISGGAAILGSYLGPFGGMAAAAAVNSEMNAASVINETYSLLDTRSDAELRQIPAYSAYRDVMDEGAARSAFRRSLLKNGPAISAAIGALTSVVGIEGKLARSFGGAKGPGRLKSAAFTGIGEMTGEGAEEGTNAYQVNRAKEDGGLGEFSWKDVANKTITGAAIGLAFGAGTGAIAGGRGAEAPPVKVPPAQPLKGAGTGNVPPPVTDVEIGNDVTPPVGSETVYPKAQAAKAAGKRRSAGVQVTEGVGADEAAALAASSPAPVAPAIEEKLAGVQAPVQEEAAPVLPPKIADPAIVGKMPSPTVAETEDQFKGQFDELLGDTRAAVFVPEGATATVPAGLKAVEIAGEEFPADTRGTYYFTAPKGRTNKTTQAKIKAAAKANKLNELLGMGPSTKADTINAGNAGEPTVALQKVNGEGAATMQQAVPAANLQENVEAIAPNMQPGDTLGVTTPGAVLNARDQGAPAAPAQPLTIAPTRQIGPEGRTVLENLEAKRREEAALAARQAELDKFDQDSEKRRQDKVAKSEKEFKEDEKRFETRMKKLTKALGERTPPEVTRAVQLFNQRRALGKGNSKQKTSITAQIRVLQKAELESRNAAPAPAQNTAPVVAEAPQPKKLGRPKKNPVANTGEETAEQEIARLMKEQEDEARYDERGMDKRALGSGGMNGEETRRELGDDNYQGGNIGEDEDGRDAQETFDAVDESAALDLGSTGEQRGNTLTALEEQAFTDKLTKLREKILKFNSLIDDKASTPGEKAAARGRVAIFEKQLAELEGKQLEAKTGIKEETEEERKARLDARRNEGYETVAPPKAAAVVKVSKGRSPLGIKPKVEGKVTLNGKPKVETKAEAKPEAPVSSSRIDISPAPSDDAVPVGDKDWVVPLESYALERALKALNFDKFGPLFPIIRDRVLREVKGVKIHIVSPDQMFLVSGDSRSLGYYDSTPSRGVESVFIRSDLSYEQIIETAIHEAVHTLVRRVMARDPNLTLAVSRIMNDTLKHFLAKGYSLEGFAKYAFTDEHEFIAEAWGNQRFQNLLKETPITRELAANLGIESWRAKSLWTALIEKINEAFRLPNGAVSALEAIARITDAAANKREAFNPQEASLSSNRLDTSKVMENLDSSTTGVLGGLRGLGRNLATNSMLGRMAKSYGEAFGGAMAKAAELKERMAAMSSKILKEEGGLDLAREAQALRTEHGDAIFSEAVDVLSTASRSRVNLITKASAAAGNIADNSHLGKDKANSVQAKKRLPELQRRMENLPDNVQDFLVRWNNWAKDESYKNNRASIEKLLRDSQVTTDEGLISRILSRQVTEQDEKLFEGNALLKHVDRLAQQMQSQGWYMPFLREGDYVASGTSEVIAPRGAEIVDDGSGKMNTVQFTDPKDKNSKTRARRAALEWAAKQDLDLLDTRAVFVDKDDMTTIVPSDDLNGVAVFRVTMQNQFTEFFPTENEAKKTAEQLREQGYNAYHGLRADNPAAEWGGMMPSQYEAITRSLQQSKGYSRLSGAARAQLVKTMHEANARLLLGNRLQHRNLPRRNVMGFNRDLPQVIANYASQSASYRAKITLQPQIDDAFKDAKAAMDANKYDMDNVKRNEIYRELEARIYSSNGMDLPGNGGIDTFIRRAAQVSFINKLAGPSFHIINLQEPWTTGLPMLAGRYGLKAGKVMTRTYDMLGARGALGAGLSDTLKALRQNDGFTDYVSAFKDSLAANDPQTAGRYGELLDHLRNVNLMGDEAGMETHRIAQPSTNKAGAALDKADIVARQVGQAVEAINRAVVGLSAYQLEFAKNGGNHQAAMAYAADTVDMTMGNYSSSNAPPIFNSRFGRFALQFKKFPQKTYYLLGHLVGRSIQGDTEAMKQFAGLMFTHSVVAGVLGLPLEPIKMALLAAGILGISGFSYDDFEDMVRRAAKNALGAQLGEVVTRGVPRAFGIDTSGRQGLDSLLFFGQPKSVEQKDLMTWLAGTVAGAPTGTILTSLDAVRSAMNGDARQAFEKAPLPKFASDAIKAGYGYSEGKVTKAGRQSMDAYSGTEAIIRAVGFTPAREAGEREARSQYFSKSKELTTERQKFTTDWIKAKPNDRAKMWGTIERWNKGLPEEARLTRSDLDKAVKRRENEKEKTVLGVVPNKRTQYIMDQALDTYNVRQNGR